KTIPLFAVRYLQPHQPPDAQQVKPHVRSRIPEATADSLCAAGEYNPLFADAYLKPQQTHNVQPVKTTPLFAVGYQKPQQTHYVQLVNTTPLFAIGYQKPLQTHDVQHVITIPCSQSDTSILIRPLMRSKLNPLSLSSFGYLKSLQATDV
ncbi:hypothetical protein ACET3U_28945, partial [Klebsiella pneumoniae]